MWYYAIDGERKGPLTEEELVQLIYKGDLDLDDFVWKHGMDDWTQISEVENIPPSPPPPPDKKPSTSSSTTSQQDQSRSVRKTDSNPKTGRPSSSPMKAETTSAGYGSRPDGPEAGGERNDSGATYAGFGRRLVAYVVDILILFALSTTFGGVLLALSGTSQPPPDLVLNVLGFLVSWIYFALNESTDKQATWGKQLMNLKVTDMNGNKIGFGKASGRHFGKILSGVILFIGYIMAAFTEKKQALHDKMAGCLVVKESGESGEDDPHVEMKGQARGDLEAKGKEIDGTGEVYCERAEKAVDPVPDRRSYGEYTCPSCRQNVENGRHPPVEEVN